MTRITRLILDGFKSFGKRTELEFGNEFNCVLGPNGSGKSNILDALCFVLGKSSSKSLRAEKSANLIYNGGKTKQPAKTAEVSIFFENSKRIFPLDENEIKVSRIVRHDGASKYQINGKTKTRQEVVELLGNAKIDPDGYNIILQGDIIRLVEMSTIERRQLIEEIAGIGVYEEKKQQALNELTKVGEKIGEAEIILKERDGYLKELKKDRDTAQKYKDLNDNIKKNKASYLKHKINGKDDELKKLEEKSSKHKEKLEKFNKKINEFRNEINTRKEKIKQISDEIESKGEVEQINIQKEVEKLRVEIASNKTRVSSCQAELHKIEQRKIQLDKNFEEIKQKLNELQAQKKAFEDTQKSTKKDLEHIEKSIKEFKIKHKLDTSTELEQHIESIDKEADEAQKQLQILREQQQQLLRDKDKTEFQLQTIDDKINKVLDLEKAHKGEIEELKRKKIEFKKTVLELNDLLNRDSQNARNLGQSRDSTFKQKEELHKQEVKNQTVQESILGNIAVKKILEQKKSIGGIFGTISELGNTSSKHALALEVAASARIHSIVVEDDKIAAKCIKYLRDNKFGVATFLPLNKIKPFEASAETKAVAKSPGVVGMAIDLISFDSQFKNAFGYVFGNTVITENIDVSRKLGIGKIRMVTLEGDITETSGAMIGGYRHQKIGSFREKELTEKIEKLAEDIENAERNISLLEKTRKEDDERINRLRELKANLEGDIIKTEKSLHLDSGDLAASQQYKEELEKQLEEQQNKLRELEDYTSEATQKVTQLKIKRQELRNQITDLKKPILIAELNSFEQKRKELGESLIKIEAEQRNIEIQINEHVGKDKENTLKVLKEMDKEKDVFVQEVNSLKDLIKGHDSELKIKEKEQEQFYSQYKSLFDQRNKMQTEINACEGKILVEEEESRKEELQVNTYSIEEARVKAELSNFQIEFSQYEGVELDMEKSEEELKKEINAFERMMANIGSVNMRALDIYDTATHEFQILLEKKGSLSKEKEDVLKLMNEIETSKKELFLRTMTVVNTNFQEIFKKLSTKGGEASLELENEEKIFEEGLKIKVRIAGEKFLDIRSLSGGEKTMTALAFLFAIQEHEPASFYIMDEVDAALDKHNSQLLAKLVRQYCNRAQYIVISHNDALISEADVLYGVSMKPEAGMSQVVSLKM